MGMGPSALIFDFDGVIADTEPLYWRAWADLLAAHGISLSWEHYCKFGRGVRNDIMLRRLPEVMSNPSILATLEKQMNAHKKMVWDWCSQQSPIPGPTVETLQSLHGYRIGLVTTSDRGEVMSLLRTAGIDSCFRAFVFGEDCRHHKPDPEPYLLILKQLGVSRGIAFEDSDAGMKSASAAGLTPIRVDDPYRLPQIVARALTKSETAGGCC